MQCRACMGFDNESVNMSHVFSEDSKNLYDYFNECTQLFASPRDNLPKNLCTTCVESVHIAFHFRKEAVRCDKEFRKRLKLSNTVPELLENSLEVAEFIEEFEVYKNCSLSECESAEENVFSISSRSEELDNREEFFSDHSVPTEECHSSINSENILGVSVPLQEQHQHNCDICNYKNLTKDNLKKHIAAQHKEDVTCTKCSRTFELPRERRLHDKLLHMTESRIRCPWCEYPKYIPRKELIDHVEKYHNRSYVKYFASGILDVDDDENDFPNILDTAEGNQNHTFYCPICFECFKKHNDYKSHIDIHNDSITGMKAMFTENDKCPNQLRNYDLKGIFQCSECPKRFQRKNSLQRHIRNTHAKNKPPESVEPQSSISDETSNENLVACKYCDKKISQYKIKSHESKHVYKLKMAGKFICSLCPREFTNEINVRTHERRIHLRQRPEPKECPVCHKKIDSKYFTTHVRSVHTDVRRFVCDICSDAFKTNMQLTGHKRLHFERKIPCTLCDKKFLHPKDLKVHMRIHTGEKPYECDLCDRQFRVKAHLTYHLQQHAGVKHACKECGQEFKDMKQLRIHSYKHTGMPFRCPVCNYQCALRNVFRKHLLKVHDMTMTPAEYCAMFKENTGRNPVVRSVEELQLEAKYIEEN